MYIITFLIFILILVSILLYLCFLYGKEEEKERWHNILLKDVKKKESLRWTATISIIYANKEDAEPKINIAIGSTKPYNSDSSVNDLKNK